MEYSIIEDQWGSGQAVVFLLLRFSSQFTRTPLPPDMFYNQQWFWKLMVVVGVALVVIICCCCGCFLYWFLRSDRNGLSAARSSLRYGKFAVICEPFWVMWFYWSNVFRFYQMCFLCVFSSVVIVVYKPNCLSYLLCI